MSHLLQILFSTAFWAVIVFITIVVMVVLTYLYCAEPKLQKLFIIAWLILLVLHFIGLACVYTSVSQAQNQMVRTLNILSDYFLFEFPINYASIPHDVSIDDPLYKEGLAYLSALQEEIEWIAAVYTFQENQNGDFVLVISPGSDLNQNNKIDLSEPPDPPGTAFIPDSPFVISKIKQILHGEKRGITDPYKDNWGRWITIFHPLYNSDGKVIAVLAIDFWGDDWEKTFFFARVWPSLFYGSFLIYFFFQFGFLLRYRNEEKNLRYYSYELEKILKDTERIQHQLNSLDQNKREFLENVHDAISVHIQQLSESMTQLQTLSIQQKNNRSQNQLLSLETLLNNIQSTGSNLLAFLDNIHTYSSIDLNYLPSQLETVPLKEFLQTINDSLNNYLKQKRNLDLHLIINEAVPEMVLIPFQIFMKIVMELLGNAIQFTHSGTITLRVSVKYPGQSQISTANEQSSGKVPSSIIPGYLFTSTFEEEPISDQLTYLKITVSDTGCGIGERHLETLFKPFHRRHNENHSHHHHQSVLTFGLCTVKRLIQIIGGRIWVESHHKHGSTFSFLLPFVLPAAQQVNENIRHKTPKVPVRPLDGLRILVVNESIANQVFITTILIEAGATTECVDNGTEAIELVCKEQQQGRYFDLIVMDSYMLQTSGVQVIYEIRNQGFMCPVILLGSAFGQQPHWHPAANNAFVSKPIDRQRLIQTITTLTKNKQTVIFNNKK
ncbi:MAG: response regulator [Planctomycetaceae bacterium]|jgi:signal transduction histidine kinase/CheY-like chemotaxis protein|nr:response regulator [Planctomycetaceae bacterium]